MVEEKVGQKTLAVMFLTLLSRIGGFIRDVILAQIFGATAIFDAFVIAFKLPNLTRRLFGEGAFAQAFIPTLVEYKTQHSHLEIKQFINKVAGVITAGGIAVVILGELLAPLLVWIFAAGFSKDPPRFLLTVQLVRITQPYLFMIAWIAFAGAILNSYHRFALTAFTPVILNLVLILTAYYVAPQFGAHGIYALAWAVLISGIFQLLAQWPALHRLDLIPKPTFCRLEEPLKKLFRRIPLALLGVSAGQISLLIDNLFASFLPAGSISWLYYADRLVYLPLGVIGAALATVTAPVLAHQHHQAQEQKFVVTLDWGLRSALVIALPAALGLFFLAGRSIAVLLEHGAFTQQDVWMTRRSLMAFAIGLPAWTAIKIFAAAFYARLDVKTPARCAGLALALNIVLNFILMGPLAHAGLALATALASWVNAVVLFVFLIKKKIYRLQPGWERVLAGMLFAAIFMSVFLEWGQGDLSHWFAWKGLERTERLLALISGAVFIYLIGLGLAGLRWRHFKP
jgi:putative peptidoglycan lipid II flippase